MEDNKSLFPRLVFGDEAVFHLSGKVNRHNVRIRRTHHPHKAVEHYRDSSKVRVFCVLSQDKVYGPFFFQGNTVARPTYLKMLQNLLFILLQADMNDVIFQQDRAQLHCYLGIRTYLNKNIPQRWIARRDAKDFAYCA